MHRYSSDFILQWYLLSPSTKNKPADCYVALSHEYAAHASARHPFVPRQAALFTSFPNPPAWTLVPTPGGILLAATLASAFSPRVLNVSERGRTSRTRRFFPRVVELPQTFRLKSHKRAEGCWISERGLSLCSRERFQVSIRSRQEKCPKSVRFPFLS